MDPERLDALATKVGGETAERVSAYVDGLSAARPLRPRRRPRPPRRPRRGRARALARPRAAARARCSTSPRPCAAATSSTSTSTPTATRPPPSCSAAALLIDLVGLTAELQGGSAAASRDRRVRRARRRAGLPPLRPRPLGRPQPPARHPEPRRPARLPVPRTPPTPSPSRCSPTSSSPSPTGSATPTPPSAWPAWRDGARLVDDPADQRDARGSARERGPGPASASSSSCPTSSSAWAPARRWSSTPRPSARAEIVRIWAPSASVLP